MGLRIAIVMGLTILMTGCEQDDDDVQPELLSIVTVTFNTGTSESMGHDSEPDDGYSGQHAEYSDLYYGDGLAWLPAVEAATTFLADVAPDIVSFQEIFDSEECVDVPEEARADFICEMWQPGDVTVAQLVLGAGYQVMCHPQKSDKCAAVNRDFGSFQGCDEDYCVEGLEGYEVDDCGNGSRIGRGTIDLVDGGELTLVNVHGTSGMGSEEMDCRAKQVDQVFVDLGDGEPGANGERNLVQGDFNTDPGRMAQVDPSAARWGDFVALDGDPTDGEFHFVTEVGADTDATYAGIMSIDHVVTDTGTGTCWHSGVTEGHPEVIDAIYFDHKAAVCTLEMIKPYAG